MENIMTRNRKVGLEASAIDHAGTTRSRVVQLAAVTLFTGAVLALAPVKPANAASCWYSAASLSGQSVTKKGTAAKKKWACNRARRKCNRARDRAVRNGANSRGFNCVRVK